METATDFKLLKDYKGHKGCLYTLAKENDDEFYSTGGDGWIVKWDASGLKDDGLLIAKTDAKIFTLKVLNDHQLIIAGDLDGYVFWIDIKNKKILNKVQGHKRSVFDFYQISDDEIVSVSRDGCLTFWDINTRQPKYAIRINEHGLRCITPDNEGKYLYLGGSDYNIYRYSIEDGIFSKWLTGAHNNSVFSIIITDDQRLISGGRDAHMKEWTMSDPPQIIHDIPAHWYTINTLADLIGTDFIASGARDKTIRLWERNGLEAVKRLDIKSEGHRASVNKLLWIEKHGVLVSTSDDRTVKLWKIN